MKLSSNPILKSSIIKVGLTIGDPAGIGPAVTLKALALLKNKVKITVIGNSFVLTQAAKLLKLQPDFFKLIDVDNIAPRNFSFGKLSAQSGKASLEYLDLALKLLKTKELDCLVTCPISKEAIYLAGAKLGGHTEYLAWKTNSFDQVMMLINKQLKFSLVTRHIPLKDVSQKITAQVLEKNIVNTLRGLNVYFGLKRPRIVVCALNPHASDNGLIGQEEAQVICPVVKRFNKNNGTAIISGPLAADLAIAQAAQGKFDCVIALYHDQALIPLKLTDFSSGVNLTLGLPFVRTSPLHGTAFDLAKKPNLACPDSLLAAIKLAIQCTLNQKKA